MTCLEIIRYGTCTLYIFHVHSAIFHLYLYPLEFARSFCDLDHTDLMQQRDHLPTDRALWILVILKFVLPKLISNLHLVLEVNREQGMSPVFSVCNNFEGRKGSCCVACCCSFLLSIHPVWVLYFSTGTYGSITLLLVVQWFCLQQYTNMSTFTFVFLRQLWCCWFRLVVNREQRVRPVFSVWNNFEGRKGSCWAVCCCLFPLSSHLLQYCTSVPALTGGMTFVVQWLHFSTGTYW